MKIPKAWKRLNADQRQKRAAHGRVRATVAEGAALDPLESAKVAGLRYVNNEKTAGIRRVGSKSRVRYVLPDGRRVSNREELARIRALVIPPAWTDVWICPFPNGHLQATGRDARGRKQYRYHARWREVRDEVKYGRLLTFAQALPRIRLRTAEDVQRSGLPMEKVLATVVLLLEKTLIRVGNEEYARDNGSVGLTTMRDKHASFDGSTVRFEFTGKSGIKHAVKLDDRRLARIVRACQDLPGHELFQCVDAEGTRRVIDSADVNSYLREISGEEFTAKDFRTWSGTVLAAKALADVSQFKSAAQARQNVVKAIESVAKRLGNTKDVCRKCYIHPAIVDAYLEGVTIRDIRVRSKRPKSDVPLEPVELAVVGLLERLLQKSS
jgi:DNA topoisomerase I